MDKRIGGFANVLWKSIFYYINGHHKQYIQMDIIFIHTRFRGLFWVTFSACCHPVCANWHPVSAKWHPEFGGPPPPLGREICAPRVCQMCALWEAPVVL